MRGDHSWNKDGVLFNLLGYKIQIFLQLQQNYFGKDIWVNNKRIIRISLNDQ